MELDAKYMIRCLELAQLAFGKVSPNPMVGCVIVHNDKIIAEGYHRQFGAKHAEIDAMDSLKDKELLRDSTMYVSLEPCSHFGKTPPCASAIVAAGIPRVVIAQKDPNPLVAGSGIKVLEAAGISVRVGLLETEAKELNKRFNCFHINKRPYVFLKWAESADGFVDKHRSSPQEPPIRISNDESSDLVHYMRSTEDAFLVGFKTALMDNPRLSARRIQLGQATRIFIDPKLEIPSDYHLLDNSIKTFVFNNKKDKSESLTEYIQIDFNLSEWPQMLLSELYKRNIQSLVVEGGPKTHEKFIKAQLWDECIRIISNLELKQGIRAVSLGGVELIREESFGKDRVERLKPNR